MHAAALTAHVVHVVLIVLLAPRTPLLHAPLNDLRVRRTGQVRGEINQKEGLHVIMAPCSLTLGQV